MRRKFLILLLALTAVLSCSLYFAGCSFLSNILPDNNINVEDGNDADGDNKVDEKDDGEEQDSDRKDGVTDSDGDEVSDSDDDSNAENGEGDNGSDDGKEENPTTDVGKHVHVYKESIVSPDCTNDGYTLHICECGDSYKDNYTKPLGHLFLNYVSDGNADCVNDGTQTAKCERCEELNTIIDEGSAFGHTLSNWQIAGGYHQKVCTTCGDVIIRQNHSYEEDGSNCDVCGSLYIDCFNSTYGYDFLGTMQNGENLQALYDEFNDCAKSFFLNGDDADENNAFAIVKYRDFGVTANEAVSVLATFRNDNPFYYWMSYTYGMGTYGADEVIVLYSFEEYASGDVRSDINESLFESISEYVSLMEGLTSVYEITLAYHDTIINAVDYAYDAYGQPSNECWAHNILGLFENKGIVCEGYAKAFQLLLNYTGINNVYVTGYAGESHAWNLVELDGGDWYWYDLTWDDDPSYNLGIGYTYFCVTDEVVLKDHTPYDSQTLGGYFLYDLPERASSAYNVKNET